MHRRSGISAVFLAVFFCLLFLSLNAETGFDFIIPAFPGSALADAQEFRLGGRQAHATLYLSNKDIFTIAGYYQDFFLKNGFAKTLDNSDEKAKIKFRHLRFKKEDLAVSVLITKRPENTEIAVVRYLQPPGTPPLEETRPSVNDPLFALPKEDCPGKDLPDIPRPPESVRIANLDLSGRIYIVYSTPLALEETRDFYKKNMTAKGWEMSNEVATEAAVKAYEKTTGKALAIESPFSDSENLSQVIKESSVLYFSGKNRRVRLTIFPNFMARSSGSMVQVDYQQE